MAFTSFRNEHYQKVVFHCSPHFILLKGCDLIVTYHSYLNMLHLRDKEMGKGVSFYNLPEGKHENDQRQNNSIEILDPNTSKKSRSNCLGEVTTKKLLLMED